MDSHQVESQQGCASAMPRDIPQASRLEPSPKVSYLARPCTHTPGHFRSYNQSADRAADDRFQSTAAVAAGRSDVLILQSSSSRSFGIGPCATTTRPGSVPALGQSSLTSCEGAGGQDQAPTDSGTSLLNSAAWDTSGAGMARLLECAKVVGEGNGDPAVRPAARRPDGSDLPQRRHRAARRPPSRASRSGCLALRF